MTRSLATILLVASTAFAADAPSALKKLSDTQYRLGLVNIDKAKREVAFPGKVNMDMGLIELLVCTSDGKTHEAVFTTDARPIDIQTALILLGAQAGKCPDEKDAPSVPVGDSVTILVQHAKSPKPVRGELFVWHEKGKRAMAKTQWTFTGSKIINGHFGAHAEGSIVATWYDSLAVINNPLPTNADDETYVANEKATPAIGTPVTIVFKLETKRDPKK